LGKQTLKQLSQTYQISVSTIQRHFSKLRSVSVISSEKQVVVLMDTTYWGRNFGVVVFKDSRTGRILWRKFIFRKETIADYAEGVDWLAAQGFQIDGIVCDGLRGMFQKIAKYNGLSKSHRMVFIDEYFKASFSR
jgi:hypothetical protein